MADEIPEDILLTAYEAMGERPCGCDPACCVVCERVHSVARVLLAERDEARARVDKGKALLAMLAELAAKYSSEQGHPAAAEEWIGEAMRKLEVERGRGS